MTQLPPLPKIDDPDLYLDVYTHKSVKLLEAPQNEEYGDTEKLTVLGASVLDLAVTYALFGHKAPTLSATELTKKKKEVLSTTNIEQWVQAYQLKSKLRYTPEAAEAIKSPEETKNFFSTYVGALYIRNGINPIVNWFSQLIYPHAQPPPSPTLTFSPPKQAVPSPPSIAPPPLPGQGTNILAQLNQAAQKKGLAATYPAESSGLPHQLTWSVRCCINGETKGSGTGRSQKVAKEEAARQAWAVLGWETSF